MKLVHKDQQWEKMVASLAFFAKKENISETGLVCAATN
jgi:hypothetical protein